MKIRTIILLLLFIQSCEGAHTKTDKGSTDIKLQKKLNEKANFVGYVNLVDMPNSGEVYIGVYLKKDNVNDDEYQKIIDLADTVVYSHETLSRYKFPVSLSAEYFNLRGLSTLKIYDFNNKFLTDADFLRIEYLNQSIMSYFIAVYKTHTKLSEGNYYGISNFTGKLLPVNYSILKDTVATLKILKDLKEKRPYGLLSDNGTHIHLDEDNSVLSVINTEAHYYIVRSIGNVTKVLYKSQPQENVMNVRFIPLTSPLPHILVNNVKPESDIEWETLLRFDGIRYKEVEKQLLE